MVCSEAGEQVDDAEAVLDADEDDDPPDDEPHAARSRAAAGSGAR